MLNFSDRTFRQFFAAELDIDIDDPRYADNGISKGKRLRSFLEEADDPTVVRTLKALWAHRVAHFAETGQADRVHNAEGRLLSLIDRLNGAASPAPKAPPPASNNRMLAALREELLRVHTLPPQQRGYAFETFLKKVFDMAGLAAREPFRNTGEQIDGSFVLGEEVYLLEAKWQAAPAPAADLHVFHGKLDQKATWARGLFVSYNGFSADGLTAFGAGKRIICMDGQDIYDALGAHIPLRSVLERKVRRAAETGRIHVPVQELFALNATAR